MGFRFSHVYPLFPSGGTVGDWIFHIKRKEIRCYISVSFSLLFGVFLVGVN